MNMKYKFITKYNAVYDCCIYRQRLIIDNYATYALLDYEADVRNTTITCYDLTNRKQHVFHKRSNYILEELYLDPFFNVFFEIKNIPEFSISIKNDLFILNHRCGSSTIRSAYLYMNNIINEDEYLNIDTEKTRGCIWENISYNTLDETNKTLNNFENVFMFYRDPSELFISQYNFYKFVYPTTSVNEFLNVVKINNMKPDADRNIHTCVQTSILNVLSPANVTLIHLKDLRKFFMERYGFNII